VESPAADITDTLDIPVGLSFTTSDILANLTTLTVGGGLTATEATLAKVTNHTVQGQLTALKATYIGLTELTVAGNDDGTPNYTGFAVSTPLTALTSLTVKAGGIFTSTSDVGIGTGTSTVGFTLTIDEGGKATIDKITKLGASTIAGALITPKDFTRNTTGVTVSPLSIVAGGSINGITFPAATTVSKIDGADAVTIEDITIEATKTFDIPGTPTYPGNEKTLTIAAGKTFTYDGVVTIEVGGKLVLAAATGNSNAKIAGTGKIVAGATTITGPWETAGTADGTVTILTVRPAALNSVAGAAITSSALTTTLKATAAGAAITQAAGLNIALTIGLNTTIDLAGTDTAAGGIITLKGGITNPGTLSMGTATSIIKTGLTGTPTAVALSTTGGASTGLSNAFTVVGITNLLGGTPSSIKASSNATVTGTTAPAGKLVSLEGVASGTATAGTAGNDGVISSLTITNPAP
jgi:hypothetical protein